MVNTEDCGSRVFLSLKFSEWLWHNLIDKVTVYADGRVVFRFRNGAEITEKI